MNAHRSVAAQHSSRFVRRTHGIALSIVQNREPHVVLRTLVLGGVLLTGCQWAFPSPAEGERQAVSDAATTDGPNTIGDAARIDAAPIIDAPPAGVLAEFIGDPMGDFDGDGISNRLDLCPFSAVQDDPDNDKLGGPCDPHPDAADCLVFFDGYQPNRVTPITGWQGAAPAIRFTPGSRGLTFLAAPGNADPTTVLFEGDLGIEHARWAFEHVAVVDTPYFGVSIDHGTSKGWVGLTSHEGSNKPFSASIMRPNGASVMPKKCSEDGSLETYVTATASWPNATTFSTTTSYGANSCTSNITGDPRGKRLALVGKGLSVRVHYVLGSRKLPAGSRCAHAERASQ